MDSTIREPELQPRPTTPGRGWLRLDDTGEDESCAVTGGLSLRAGQTTERSELRTSLRSSHPYQRSNSQRLQTPTRTTIAAAQPEWRSSTSSDNGMSVVAVGSLNRRLISSKLTDSRTGYYTAGCQPSHHDVIPDYAAAMEATIGKVSNELRPYQHKINVLQRSIMSCVNPEQYGRARRLTEEVSALLCTRIVSNSF